MSSRIADFASIWLKIIQVWSAFVLGLDTKLTWTTIWSPRKMYALFIVTLVLVPEYTIGVQSEPQYEALVNLTYKDQKGVLKSKVRGMGWYASDGIRDAEQGVLVHVRSEYNKSVYACTKIIQPSIESESKWIALIKRGECNFTTKVINAAMKSNASAVVIYNNEEELGPTTKFTGRVYNGRFQYNI